MLSIIAIVALLAQGSQILRIAVLRRVVEVSDGEDNPDYDWSVKVFLSSLGHITMILDTTELASVVCPLEYFVPNILPVRRIAFSVFWLNRHNQSSFFAPEWMVPKHHPPKTNFCNN